MKLGTINKLIITRETENGFYLQNLNGDEVLLPNRYIDNTMKMDSKIAVFVYTDSEDRLVASTDMPYGFVNEFAYLEVKDVTKIGAFMNWGLPKDLFVPRTMQKTAFRVGEKRIIRIIEDIETGRLIGVEKIKQFLNPDPSLENFHKNDEVNILIFAKTPLGFKVIVNHKYEGMIYHNEIFEKLFVGFKRKAYIKNIREDNKIDLSLNPLGDAKDEKLFANLLITLEKNGGEMAYHSDSDSEEIVNVFNMSKKNFKKSLVELSKRGLIKILDNRTGIKLINNTQND